MAWILSGIGLLLMTIALRALLGAAGHQGGGGEPDPGGSEVEFITSAAHAAESGTTTTINVPESAQAGDLLVTAVFVSSNDGNGDPPSDMDGWTLIHTAVVNNFNRRTYLAYIVLPETPPATYQWTGHGGSASHLVVTACYRGQNDTTPILDEGWNITATPPELTAVNGCAAFGAWRRISAGGEVPPEMTAIEEGTLGATGTVPFVAYETGLTAGAYSRTADVNTPVSGSMVLIQP